MAYLEGLFETVPERSDLRLRITERTRKSEEECIREFLGREILTQEQKTLATETAMRLARSLRNQKRPGIVEQLVQEFSLASEEGVALMSLAEALLRTPDEATRDDLIRDQVCLGNWLSHSGRGKPLIINAASWGLALTRDIVAPSERVGRVMAFVKRRGMPFIRLAMRQAMQMMGRQFVMGETIEQALKLARKHEDEGFTYSYDMLGEAALDQADADRYKADYHAALEAIGKNARGSNVYERAGLSIKLSALHPRYSRLQRDRVMSELLPIVKDLAVRARHYDIGLNIDAEESERLEISLDLLESLCQDPDLAGWNGIGFVVQAYGRRAPAVLDYIIDLGRRTDHRIMVRLVKGAYWDSEVKKAQIDGASDFPVYTRKCHTDVSYLACAAKLLAAPKEIFPQFATHNARTVASIFAMAGHDFSIGRYEFQCLHGMGEPLYSQVVGSKTLNRPCRIYAPVGTYETLLAYLVRRLLENGANSSFVNLVGDHSVPLEKLVEDPVEQTHDIYPVGSRHPLIKAPQDLFGKERKNSAGMDLYDENTLRQLKEALKQCPETSEGASLIVGRDPSTEKRDVLNPADQADVVGTIQYATAEDVTQAVDVAEKSTTAWASKSPADRAGILEHAADLLEEKRVSFMALAIREAGKSYPNAVSEVREAIDFLRYYASLIRADFSNDTHRPLGTIVCISPWNFPLAIFLGQVTAALAAGNNVLAKPAESTSLIAVEAVKLMHKAGVPAEALQLVLGRGSDIGTALVSDKRIAGVMFTGSTKVAQSIAGHLAGRLGRNGQPVPFVAETGGLNAMIVDSTALPEQAIVDIVNSAFDSAGQRCSALRLLCVQDEAMPRILPLLKGAMAELRVGAPGRLETDVGPVINQRARDGIMEHITRFKDKKYRVFSSPLVTEETECGFFVPPTLIQVHSVEEIGGEVFGPVLHVMPYHRRGLETLVRDINATGYGLTFGVHSRLPSTINRLVEKIEAGNVYVNRNMVGAVVGVQPFGGRGLSGTGPKAGGPLAVRRQLAEAPACSLTTGTTGLSPMSRSWLLWLRANDASLAQEVLPWMSHGLLGTTLEMPSPVGETNHYSLTPRGEGLILAETEAGLKRMISYAISCGNQVCVMASPELTPCLRTLPDVVAKEITIVKNRGDVKDCAFILSETENETLWQIVRDLLQDEKHSVPLVYIGDAASLRPEWLLEEKHVSNNVAAAGGNARLMAQI
ncbi:bifunctional proline dehydrogenase/L-glutamate gamma-semialdehyde dehydrogenase PutA [Acetobacteraceae bacterium ESL0709]|nr:bifunctional proline dehydrogenase/L-glutamate gamma-semialdehyde dehydrogenase PutA [Acetobacteraceae bacterium ESL0697]MDF7677249.1 bifunctional proline dehydrogenase/L-glutamate gamma-semialdehyde dehydrogenase PutA [Acetobacteraceae bacterium ESL0709]